ncbi:hypothetical protein ACET3Z_010343 [Daucus carota]
MKIYAPYNMSESPDRSTSRCQQPFSSSSVMVHNHHSGMQVSVTQGPHPDQGFRGKEVQMKGKNTFAAPRNVRPLGYTNNINTKSDVVGEVADEQPKSNDKFRKMLLRK